MVNRLAASTTTIRQTVAVGVLGKVGPIKNTATPISSMPTADKTESRGKLGTGVLSMTKAEKKSEALAKMEIASTILLCMSNQKDITRKQFVEEFVAEAKLSAPSASTHYQLVQGRMV
jgi:hypothetical protein